MKVHFYTFGCKVNQYETENIKQNFIKKGFDTTENISEGDIFIINTCTVTSMSDRKCRQYLNKIKHERPSSIVVLTGCFPQAFQEDAQAMNNVDIITGSSNKNSIPDHVEKFLINRKKIIDILPHTKEEKFEKMKISDFNKTRAYIKIQDGCNQYCTYCIIPYARGFIRSKPIDELKAEIEALAKSNHKEIVLVGINLSCYGREFGLRLVDAVEAACSIDGIKRVRLGSLEAELLSNEDIERMSKQKKLCPQFHLSLQSGCDKTLKAMNRKYTSEQYYQIATKLRSCFEDCAITTDIMVGFPNETEEDFNESVKFAKKMQFAQAHIFPYSIREGTVAAKMPNQIEKSIKKTRAKIMTEAVQKSQENFLQNQLGKKVSVLIETISDDGVYIGHTANYLKVKIVRNDVNYSLKNTEKYVKIIELKKNYCIGQFID